QCALRILRHIAHTVVELLVVVAAGELILEEARGERDRLDERARSSQHEHSSPSGRIVVREVRAERQQQKRKCRKQVPRTDTIAPFPLRITRIQEKITRGHRYRQERQTTIEPREPGHSGDRDRGERCVNEDGFARAQKEPSNAVEEWSLEPV